MPSVGSYLRGLRQRRGVSLDEISRSTRIPQRYLEALEGDDFAPLPAPPFTRGFIRAYCQALHEPPDEALACYDADRAGRVGPHVAQPHDARTSELTWVRVRTEDGRMSEENIPAGEIREWVSNRPFVLSIGNAGGVTLELNGRRLPPLGPSGAVIARLVVPTEGQ